MTTEEFFATLVRYAQGQESEQSVRDVVGRNATLTLQRKQKFEIDYPPGNPEIDPRLRAELEQGFQDYLVSLEELSENFGADSVSRLLPELQKAVRSIRTAQLEHERNLVDGATPLPYLNRFLLHYDRTRAGGDSANLKSLLSEHTTFIQWLSKELAKRQVALSGNTLVFQLRQFFSSVGAALEREEALPDIHQGLVEVGNELARALLADPLSQQVGPTEIPAVNQLFEALATLTGDPEELGYLLDLIEQCRHYLRTLCPTRSRPAILQALSDVLTTLEEMARVLTHERNFEQLESLAERLEAQANGLYQTVQAELQTQGFESSEYERQTADLPPFFRSALLPAFRFVETGDGLEDLEAAADFMEGSVDYYSTLLENAEREDTREALEQSMALTRDAAALMRSLTEEGNPTFLTLLCSACRQASVSLRQAGVPLR